MIAIDDKLLSDELFEKKFVCDLSACKGACCVEGESGAPVADDEREKLREIWPVVKEYITAKGVAAIEEQGHFIVDEDGEYVTPLIDGKECAYTVFEADGMARCGIEKAAREGKIDWLKPVSCHLYPVRITKLKDFDAINFHTWEVCEPACDCGSKLDVHVYKFLKEPFIRKYGEDFFEKMEAASELYRAQMAKLNQTAK
jgi:hypothetical protein